MWRYRRRGWAGIGEPVAPDDMVDDVITSVDPRVPLTDRLAAAQRAARRNPEFSVVALSSLIQGILQGLGEQAEGGIDAVMERMSAALRRVPDQGPGM